MEVIPGAFHAVFPMGDASRVGEARRHAAALASDCGLDEVDAGRLAMVVTELGTNLVRHAQRGPAAAVRVGRTRGEVEVIAVDTGPGIAGRRALPERRLLHRRHARHRPGRGAAAGAGFRHPFQPCPMAPSCCRARAARTRARERPGHWRARAPVSLIAAPARTVCGDSWALRLDGERAAVDGGRRPGPRAGCRRGVAGRRWRPSPRTLGRVRAACSSVPTQRCAAPAAPPSCSAAARRAGAARIRSAGAGNVVGAAGLGRAATARCCASMAPPACTIRTPEEVTHAWPPHALLVVYTRRHRDALEGATLVPAAGRRPAAGRGAPAARPLPRPRRRHRRRAAPQGLTWPCDRASIPPEPRRLRWTQASARSQALARGTGGDQPRRAGAVRRAGRPGRPVARGHRAQEPLPGLHEP